MPLYVEQVDARKGRCAVASVPLQAGSCILRTSPICAFSSSSCSWCFTPQLALSRCTGCRKVCYCSRRCQQHDWSQHRRECSAWRSIPAQKKISATVLLVCRLSAKLFLSSDVNEEEKNRVLQLRHHLDDHSDVQRQEFHAMAQLVLLLLSRYKPATKQLIRGFDELQNDLETEILQLFGRVNCNAFSIANELTNETVGIGLYPESALLNHDCDPNCVVSFKGREMVIHVIKDVRVGQELTVSYIELFQSTKRRQNELKTSYFFDCKCTRCEAAVKEKVEDWYLDGLTCDNNKGTTSCKGVVVVEEGDDHGEIARCTMCGALRDSDEIRRLEKLLKDVEERKDNSEQDKWEQYQRKWAIMTSRLRLHPRNARVAVLAREIGNFLSEATALDLRRFARPFFLAELHAVKWLLPKTKLPSRGLLHFQLGKLLFEEAATLSQRNQAEQIQSAREHLKQALVMLNCAYGSGSAAVQSAQIMLDEVQHTALEP